MSSDWLPYEELPPSEQVGIAPYCPGGFVTRPLPASAEDRTTFLFDTAQTRSDNSAEFSGDVRVEKNGLTAEADRIRYDGSALGELQGDVSLHIPGVALSSHQADINLTTQDATLTEAEFVLPEQDMHGQAAVLNRQGVDLIRAENIAFTRCAPSPSPAWQIKASTLEIDNEEQVARAWNSRLEVKNIPVMYVPYLSFPLNDQPRTGFLIPTFGNGYYQEYYLHLAPNYDDTLAVNYVGNSGLYGHNEFRFLIDDHNGINQIQYKLIDTSDGSAELDSVDDIGLQRWSVEHKQSGRLAGIGYDIKTRWVSDTEYDVDLTPGSDTLIETQKVKLAFTAEPFSTKSSLAFAYTQPVANSDEAFSTLNTTLSVKKTQTTGTLVYETQSEFVGTDTVITPAKYDVLKVPELTLSHNTRWPLKIATTERLQYSVFSRELTAERQGELTSANVALNTETQRLHSSLKATRTFQAGPSTTIPTITGLVSHYQYDNSLDDTADDEQHTQLGWQASLDQRFRFESDPGTWQQSLSPRFYLGYAPLFDHPADAVDSDDESSFTLFSASRFTGVDRVGDMTRLSTSLAYDLKLDNRTVLAADVKKGVKLSQERVTLTTLDDIDANWVPEYSDWIASAKVYPTEQLSLSASMAMDHETHTLNTYATELKYTPSEHVFFTIAAERTDDEESLKAGTYFPIRPNMALVGYASLETQEEEPTWADYKPKELLLGLDIDSCCWNLRFAVLETSAAEDEDGTSIFLENSTIAPYFEFTLKGIGAGIGTIENMLNRLDFGYSGPLFNYR